MRVTVPEVSAVRGQLGQRFGAGALGRHAARRDGPRADGFFPGGSRPPAERVAQLELVRTTAEAEGRDPAALEYTRLGSVDMGPGAVHSYAAQGVDRLVVSASSPDLAEQLRQLEAFATRHDLPR